MKRSRHLEAIFKTVAHDFIRAHVEGIGVAVALTPRELITAKARLFRGPVLRRYRLADVGQLRVRRGKDVNCLFIDVGGKDASTAMVLYTTAAARDVDQLVAAIDRMSRRRNSSGHATRGVPRRHSSALRRVGNRQQSTLAVP
jgi:hypothetical protein